MIRQRVLFLSASAGEYGAENALLDLIKSLSKEVEPIVLVREPGPLVDSLTELGVTCKTVPFTVLDRQYFHPLRILAYKASALLSTFRLIHEIRHVNPSVVHTNNVLILPGAFAARLLGIPHVWHVREIVENHHISPILWRIWRWIIVTLSARVICISSAVRDQFGESKKAVVIHDGIDTELFQPLKAPQSKKVITFGIVGRLEHRRKGQDTFIETAKIALESRKNLRFIIVGHEREDIADREQTLHDTVERYGISESVEFRGFVSRDQMPALMHESLNFCDPMPYPRPRIAILPTCL